MKKISIVYATRSEFKRQEIGIVLATSTFTDSDGVVRKVGERFNINFSDVRTDEPLEIDLVAMVKHKAVSAYRGLLMPCIVEHAGLIIKEHEASGFPGGLTQPMWDALGGEGFLRRTGAAGEPAIAKAVFGYCDGMGVYTFVGETDGAIATEPRGSRRFYWDTVFCPNEFSGKTYAEVSEDPAGGIQEKMKISQSFKALRDFLELRAKKGEADLFSGSA
jgi:XTP/dITP diphosphohydrolase